MPVALEPIRYEHGHRGFPPIHLPFHIVQLGGDIQAAITAAAADGRHIWIHPGVYVLPASLTVPAAARIYIWGCGQDTIIRAPLAVTRMFNLAAGFAEFGLFNLTCDIGLVGHVRRVVTVDGASTGELYFSNVAVTGIYAAADGNFVFGNPPGSLSYVLIDHCNLVGALWFRDLVRADIRDSQLDAHNLGHNFTHCPIYSARNIWSNTAAVAAMGASGTGVFHDDGSSYAGNICLVVDGDGASLRGCHFVGVQDAIGINGGEVRIADSYIQGGRYAIHQSTLSADNLGVSNCDIVIGPAGALWGILIDDGYAEIVGNCFVNSGVRVNPLGRCLLGSNNITATSSPRAVYISADNCNISDNRILFSALAAAIQLDGDHNAVTGNMLHNYTIGEGAVAGNVIEGNRVGA